MISSRKLVAGKRPAFLSSPIVDRPLRRTSLDSFREPARRLGQIRFRIYQSLRGSVSVLLIYESNLIDAHTICRGLDAYVCYLPFRPRRLEESAIFAQVISLPLRRILSTRCNCSPGTGIQFSLAFSIDTPMSL